MLRILEQVNPRACGGDCICGSSTNMTWGQSPRVRGRLGTQGVSAKFIGSIPARAGETRK